MIPTPDTPSLNLFTTEQLAYRLRVGKSTIRKYVHLDELHPVVFGRVWRFDPVEVQQFIRSKQKKPQGTATRLHDALTKKEGK